MMIIVVILITFICQPSIADPLCRKPRQAFTTDFRLDACTFSTTGSNQYFILEPGYQLKLAGEEDGVLVELSITVLDETETIGPIETRVVEEKEWHDGELIEASRNFFALCIETSSVFYFGEDVDIYEDGQIVSHEGAWRAFEDDNQPGLIMSGTILLGARYFQEIAPDVAMDRAVIIRMDAELETTAGEFENCLVTLETTPLEPSARSWKVYAPGVGLIKDGDTELVQIVRP
ncbi:hypothetical protein HZA56_18145 [Candidatus Poribacteria bacterium]|nr:hypothetical protein [Candidatus Poribacteria bacterium]